MSTITYLTAQWCQPCKTYLPLVQKAADGYGHTLEVLDIDETAGAKVATMAGVMRVPALVIGACEEVYIGPRTPRQVAAIMENLR